MQKTQASLSVFCRNHKLEPPSLCAIPCFPIQGCATHLTPFKNNFFTSCCRKHRRCPSITKWWEVVLDWQQRCMSYLTQNKNEPNAPPLNKQVLLLPGARPKLSHPCCQNPGSSRSVAAAGEGKEGDSLQQNWPQQRVKALALGWVCQSTPGCLRTLLPREDAGCSVEAPSQGQAAPVGKGLHPWGCATTKAGGSTKTPK